MAPRRGAGYKGSVRRPRMGSLAAAVGLLTAAGPLWAGSDSHYQDTLIGERAAGMGGAFTAISDEATGAFYNPAGIARARADLIQVSMSAFRLRQKEIRVADICGREVENDHGSFLSFPAALGFVKLIDGGSLRHAVGLTLAVPASDKIAFASSESNIQCSFAGVDFGQSEFRVERILEGGVTYALALSSRLSLGLGLAFSVRSLSSTQLSIAVASSRDGDRAQISTTGSVLESNVWSSFLRLGVLWQATDHLSLGLAVVTPAVRLHSHGRLDLLAGGSIFDANEPLPSGDASALFLEDAEFYFQTPWALAFGAALSTERGLTLAADLRVHLPVAGYRTVASPDLRPDEAPYAIRRLIVNANLGASYALSADWELRAGLFTNFSAVPEDALEASWLGERIDLFGATLGASLTADEHSSLGAALQAQMGRGESLSARLDAETAALDLPRTPVDELSIILYVGGRYDLR